MGFFSAIQSRYVLDRFCVVDNWAKTASFARAFGMNSDVGGQVRMAGVHVTPGFDGKPLFSARTDSVYFTLVVLRVRLG